MKVHIKNGQQLEAYKRVVQRLQEPPQANVQTLIDKESIAEMIAYREEFLAAVLKIIEDKENEVETV